MLTGFGGMPITYDAQGNPTNYLGHTLTWEKGRQLKKFDNIEYTYNANGIRTSKKVNGVLHTYTLDGTKILRETWDGNTLIPLYDNEESVCGVIYNDVPYYFHKNLQGDVIAIVDKNGDTVARYTYDAWGACTIQSDSTGCCIASINPFRYRGYYYDIEIDMYYLQSRYYDPNTGRFINVDMPEYVSIQWGGLYTYCGNSPIKNADYFGFCCVPTYPETYVPSYSSPTYSYGKKKNTDGLLKIVLKSIGMICLVVSALAIGFVRDMITLINENKWVQGALDTLEIALPIIAGFIGAAWLGTVGIVIGVISLIAAIFDKDNSIFDWFGIGFDISNHIKKKKWKEVAGTIFSKFDEIIAFLKKVF